MTSPHNYSKDEVDELKARLAEAEKDATRSRHEWQRECEDTDLLLQGMGLCPSEYRSECGSLLLARIRHKMGHIGLRLDETLARLAALEGDYSTVLKNLAWHMTRLAEVESALKGLVYYPNSNYSWAEAFKIFPPVSGEVKHE